MNVYRRKRVRNGKPRHARCYTGKHRFCGDMLPTIYALGVTNKDVAKAKLAELVQHEEKRRAGMVLPERQVETANRALLDLLKMYIADQTTKGHSPDYIRHLDNRVKRLSIECKWERVGDVTSRSFEVWRDVQSTMSQKTKNEYLAAITSFMNWLLARELIAGNPVKAVGRVDQRGRETFHRRALTSDEITRLLSVAGDRKVLYLTAVLTTLRRNALYHLQWCHVHLDGENPRIVLPAALSKNRTEEVKPLRDDLVNELRKLRPAVFSPRDRVFKGLLPSEKTDFFKADLAKAGIDPVDALGDRLDFHALRHTAATLGGATGAGEHLLMSLTGHKTASQVKRYVHQNHLPSRAIVNQMPRFDSVLDGTPQGTPAGGKTGDKSGQSETTDKNNGWKKMPENKGKTAVTSRKCERTDKRRGGDSNPAEIAIPDELKGDGTLQGTLAQVQLQNIITTWPRLTLEQRAAVAAVVRSLTASGEVRKRKGSKAKQTFRGAFRSLGSGNGKGEGF